MRADFFVSEAPQSREIQIGTETCTFYFRELGDADCMHYAIMAGTGDDDERAAARAWFLSMAIVAADNKPAMTHEQAKKLRAPIARDLFAVAWAISNPKAAEAKKKSVPEASANSGTS